MTGIKPATSHYCTREIVKIFYAMSKLKKKLPKNYKFLKRKHKKTTLQKHQKLSSNNLIKNLDLISRQIKKETNQ